MKIPDKSLISREEANEIRRTAHNHFQCAEDGIAIHMAEKDGILYVLGEINTEEANKVMWPEKRQ